MIGSERGELRVIGNYGMRRELSPSLPSSGVVVTGLSETHENEASTILIDRAFACRRLVFSRELEL
jgi:hypothetical protein